MNKTTTNDISLEISRKYTYQHATAELFSFYIDKFITTGEKFFIVSSL